MTKESRESSDVQADLYEDNKVDFKDFAILGDSCLEREEWL